jgi:hypothetical protein
VCVSFSFWDLKIDLVLMVCYLKLKPWETYSADLSINLTKHHAPVTLLDRMAYWTVKSLRWPTDLFFQVWLIHFTLLFFCYFDHQLRFFYSLDFINSSFCSCFFGLTEYARFCFWWTKIEWLSIKMLLLDPKFWFLCCFLRQYRMLGLSPLLLSELQ